MGAPRSYLGPPDRSAVRCPPGPPTADKPGNPGSDQPPILPDREIVTGWAHPIWSNRTVWVGPVGGERFRRPQPTGTRHVLPIRCAERGTTCRRSGSGRNDSPPVPRLWVNRYPETDREGVRSPRIRSVPEVPDLRVGVGRHPRRSSGVVTLPRPPSGGLATGAFCGVVRVTVRSEFRCRYLRGRSGGGRTRAVH